MATIVRRVSGWDGTLPATGRRQRVTGRFPDTREGRKAAAQFASPLCDVEIFYDVRVRTGSQVQTKAFRRRKEADAWTVQFGADRLRGLIPDSSRGRLSFQEVANRWFEARVAKRSRSIDRDRGILDKVRSPQCWSTVHCECYEGRYPEAR
jgi:hypothetical protein